MNQVTDVDAIAERGRGLVVNFLPFLSPEGSRRVTSCPTPARERTASRLAIDPVGVNSENAVAAGDDDPAVEAVAV